MTTQAGHTADTIQRSRSGSCSSSSSLTSSSSFDPHDISRVSPTPDERRPSALGIRDIQRLYRADKKEKARGREREQTRPIDVQHEPGSSRIDLTSPVAGPAGEVFAADVSIRGWKVVGGEKWSGDARVGAYVVYDIGIIKRNGGEIEILRRYTDFVRLRSALKSRFPHLSGAIPSLPGKNHITKFSEKLLEDRRPRLQRFLRTVMLHPEMGRGGLGSVDESVESCGLDQVGPLLVLAENTDLNRGHGQVPLSLGTYFLREKMPQCGPASHWSNDYFQSWSSDNRLAEQRVAIRVCWGEYCNHA